MKTFSCIILASLFLFSCSRPNKKETIISGKIINPTTDKLYYSLPLKGLTYIGFRDTIILDSTGIFSIRTNLKAKGIIRIYYKKLYGFYLNPGDSVFVTINNSNSKQHQKLHVTGPNNIGNIFYNNLKRSFYPVTDAKKYYGDTIKKNVVDKLNKSRIDELTRLDSLRNEIEPSFYDYLKTDINVYYECLKSEIASLYYFNVFHQNEKNDIKIPLSMDSLWRETYNNYNINFSGPIYPRWWYYYSLNYFNGYLPYIENNRFGSGPESHLRVLDEAKQYLDKKNLEIFLARYIDIFAKQNNFERELITMYDSFISMFPTSPFIKFLEPEIRKIKDYYNNLKKLHPEIHLIKDYNKINNLKELTDLFKGKPVLIDVWATWCSACISEFPCISDIYSTYQDSIVFLFISTDRNNRKQQWINIIQGHNLKGQHILANSKLQNDLFQILGDSTGAYMIPRYLLLDKHGNIFDFNAPEPKDGEKLKQELNQLIK